MARLPQRGQAIKIGLHRAGLSFASGHQSRRKASTQHPYLPVGPDEEVNALLQSISFQETTLCGRLRQPGHILKFVRGEKLAHFRFDYQRRLPSGPTLLAELQSAIRMSL
jgi:hypothetical protein